MPTIKKLCRVLGISHPEDQSTCIGYCVNKPTCRNLVAGASRSAATRELVDICDALARGVNPSRLGAQLQNVAKLLHCKRSRDHQSQAPSKAQKWGDRVIEYVEERQDAGRYIRVQPRRSTSSSQRQLGNIHVVSPTRTAISLSSIGDEDLLGELAARFELRSQTIRSIEAIMAGSYYRMDNRTALSPATEAASGRHGGDVYDEEGYSSDETSGEDEYSSDEESEEEPSSDARFLRHAASGHAARPVLPPPSPPRGPLLSSSSSGGSGSGTRTSRSSSSSSSLSRTSRATSPSSSPAESECGICLCGMPSQNQRQSNSSIWRCATCHNATHAICFDEWMARSTRDRVTCIYWYVLSSHPLVSVLERYVKKKYTQSFYMF
ncbi:uncharacterized protein Z519_00790 [Cladophialophora bantiana CBS 173.52]|uniref:Uncharacterized protein n=1 Tax=Cladophialophora bantiana (strain ATCC 10958 / CBS 173.52 / CDC B-1940 / NIH 8579) TaxID=1442370 RepID=A0A0D2GL75_CLAB1|nr:uncharacterized protein Z519_00790 [Cladophialophora bantiana CBS 173.52]KIW99127.1 hypothetical protein Z519_00790 [Cladophialophora bantiana CBS 173.52]